MVGRFWLTMAEIYGGRFTDHMGETSNSEWINLFAKLDRQQVERGCQGMRADERFADWPPTVIRFEHLCKHTAEDMGLPSVNEAYQMAIGNQTQRDLCAKRANIDQTLRCY